MLRENSVRRVTIDVPSACSAKTSSVAWLLTFLASCPGRLLMLRALSFLVSTVRAAASGAQLDPGTLIWAGPRAARFSQ